MKTGLCIDNHIAVAADLRSVWARGRLAYLRHVCMSGHAPYMGIPMGMFPEVEGDNWCNLIQRRECGSFVDKYRRFLDSFDFFVATMPPILAMMYDKIDKPIVLVLPVRYEYGATGNAELWGEWNAMIRRRTREGSMVVVANNEYDRLYFNKFLPDVECRVITTVGDYTGMVYNPVRNKVLYYASWDALDGPRLIRKQRALQAGHAWQSVAEYKAVIHIPYNVSTMSMYEHRNAGIPIIAPSKRLMRQWRAEGAPVLNQVSWNEACNQTPGSVLKPDGLDPNDYRSSEVFDMWLDNCELYNGVLGIPWTFDNNEELNDIVESRDLRDPCEGYDCVDVRDCVRDAWCRALRDVVAI